MTPGRVYRYASDIKQLEADELDQQESRKTQVHSHSLTIGEMK
jgi:hypothetical protein